MKRLVIALFVIVVVSPTMALAAEWYRCRADGQVRDVCCCPERADDAETPAGVGPGGCCDIVQASPAVPDTRMTAGAGAALAAVAVPRRVVDVTPPAPGDVRPPAPEVIRPASRAPPRFLANCSLLL